MEGIRYYVGWGREGGGGVGISEVKGGTPEGREITSMKQV